LAHNFLVAKGSRWELGEFIVCLDLYLRVGAVHEHHPEVIKASKIIDRSTGSIALRIANFGMRLAMTLPKLRLLRP
jgi:hypothetical protein